jgi:1-acyl-sn-glycerol-3-phosphate acyltransferase
MPPAPIRRPLTISLWLVLSVTALVLSPVLIGIAAVVSAVTRGPRALIVARLVVAYFAYELAVMVACGALWLASGAGVRIRSQRFQRLHYRLLRWFAHGLTSRALELLDIEVAPEPSEEATRALTDDGPLLFFSRHAGPGDTFLLTDQLLSRFDRLPRVVFKQELAIDPSVDLIGHRLPHAVLDTSDRQECEAQIAEVTAGLDRRGVLLLFPEGGNFTEERRRGALRSLRRKGLRREAAKAEQMTNVLPPRPTGALAALRSNPAAGVIFAAHTGLGLAAYPSDLWRDMPIGRTLRTGMWLVPADERPSDPEAQVEWLYGWWKRLDEWVEGRAAAQPGTPQEADTSRP